MVPKRGLPPVIGLAIAAVACSTCLIWGYLIFFRGGFWRAREHDDILQERAAPGQTWPRILIVVPARDEEAFIGGSVASLLRQDYPGELTLIVVDDHSSDRTSSVAAAAAAAAADDIGPVAPRRRFVVVAAPGLPRGWSGKLWAVAAGIRHGSTVAFSPEYILLTDADIHHAPESLTELVRQALARQTVLTSRMVRLRCTSFAERALIPAFVFFFQMLFPFAWVNRPERSTAAAAGGCMLVQKAALDSAGGVEAIRGELIDDCALARLLKPHGAIWLGLTDRAESMRPYESMGDVARMVIRSAYAQLRFSPWLLALAMTGMLITYLAPPALALFGSGIPQLAGVVSWAAMALAYYPILRFYRLSPAWGLALPAIAMLYLACTVMSAYRHVRRRGGIWKGRVHLEASAE